MSTHAITAAAEIDAPRARVWEVLRDVERYPEWNPFTVEVRTSFELGAPVAMRVALRPPLVIPQTERITSYVEGERFSWGTTMLSPAFLTADRTQVLEDLPGGRTRYTTTDTFTGYGVPVVVALTGRWVQRGFDDVARALQARCGG